MAFLDSPGLTSTPSSAVVNTPTPELQPYVANVLQKGNALVNTPMPAYTGQLTAGPSNLQTQAWQGLSNLTLPSTLTQSSQNLQDIQQKAQNVSFDPSQIGQYMNPYLQQSLNPQLEEARRQSQITQMGNAAKSTQAGAFGGSRQAIMDAETQRNLGTNLANITGQGYKTAYDEAMKAAQYGTDVGLRGLQQATTANQAAGNIGAQEAQYGLQNLQALGTSGNVQQGQNQAALNAQYNEYLRQLKYPQDILKFQQGIIQGMPGGSQALTYGSQQSDLQKISSTAANIATLQKNLKEAGLTSDAISNALKSMGYTPDQISNPYYKVPGTDDPNLYNPTEPFDPYRSQLPEDQTYDFGNIGGYSDSDNQYYGYDYGNMGGYREEEPNP
jgi:hypothetical protein